jgi:hypothetical protein
MKYRRRNAEIRRGLKTAAVQQQLALEGSETSDRDAQTFTRYFQSEMMRDTPLQ